MTALTKALKSELSRKMIQHAVQKKELSFGIAAENITSDLAALIMAVAHGHVSELSLDRWADLIENNVVNRRAHSISVFETNEPIPVPFGSVLIPCDNSDYAKFKDVLSAMYLAWPKLFAHINVHGNPESFELAWGSILNNLPHIPGTFSIISDVNQHYENTMMNNQGIKVHNRAKGTLELAKQAFFEAVKLMDDLTEVFSTLRSIEQLHSRFPASVWFLSDPVRKQTQPKKAGKPKPLTELVKSVTKRIEDGIPTT